MNASMDGSIDRGMQNNIGSSAYGGGLKTANTDVKIGNPM